MAGLDTSTIVLFDVDGTLTAPRLKIEPKMEEFLQLLKTKVTVGLVGGSDLAKIKQQMGEDVLERFTYVFSENGLVSHVNGDLVEKMSISKHLGEETIQKFINFALKKMSEITLPCKRGTFIEFRNGLINVCPVGRSCSQAERDQFGEYDAQHHVREKLVQDFKQEFPDAGLSFVIGGQISMDVFPSGWDKTYSLKSVQKAGYQKIYFFGDKTAPGGNDHEIFADPRTIGHTVTSPDDTMQQLKDIFFTQG